MATTTNYSWSTPDNTAYVKDGASSIRTLGSSVDTTLFTALGGTYPGLRLVKKQTIGNAVSSVAVTSAFSATYENYKIIVTGGVASTSALLALTMTGATSNYYQGGVVVTYSSGSSTINNSNQASWGWTAHVSTNNIHLDADIKMPFLTKNTLMTSQHIQQTTAGGGGTFNGFLNDSNSYTGFTITPSSGTLTGGTIYVYGYGAS